jgi:hypothetical protein
MIEAMFRGALVLTVLCASTTSAAADVYPDDAVIEVGLEYAQSPIRFDDEREAVVATSLHFTDRNGVFARELARFLDPPPAPGPVSDEEVTETVTGIYRFYGVGYQGRIVATEVTHRTRTPEEKARLQAEKDDQRERMLGRRAFHTEVQVYVPREDQSNTRGVAINMRMRVAGNPYISLEVGVGYTSITSDVCTTNNVVDCEYLFYGLPLRVVVPIKGRGMFQLGWDYNIHATSNPKPYHIGWNPIRASVTLNPVDRLFVRGTGFASPQALGELGFGVEIGGRL